MRAQQNNWNLPFLAQNSTEQKKFVWSDTILIIVLLKHSSGKDNKLEEWELEVQQVISLVQPGVPVHTCLCAILRFDYIENA